MATPQILTAATICTSFPEMPKPIIARENLLVALETMLAGDLQMIILEGEEGVGKTTLLAQFANRNSERTISVFIRPTSWYTSDPEILTSDLINQMNWIVSNREIPSRQVMGRALLRRSVYELMRFAGRTSKKIVFIIDGLTTIPAERHFSRDAILELIPFGYPQFKFIFSGNSQDLAGLKPLAHRAWKTFQVPPFSRDEVRTLFGAEVSQTFIDDMYSVCKGLPGYLATILRLLKTGAKPEELTNDLPTSLPQLFDLEWKAVDKSNRLQVEILAFLAHDKNPHSVADLEVLFRESQHDIIASLKQLGFVSVPANSTAPIQFVSDAFRTYAAQQLSRESRVVVDRVVDSLLSQPESAVALKLLPTYLSETARHQNLLEYLSPDRFERMLAMTEQLTPVQRTIDLGFRTAQKLNKDEELFRFGVQSSTVAELNGFDVSRAEIEARMALGQVEASEALCHGCVLKEDRLRLLAVIARKKKEQNVPIEPESLLQLEKMFDDVDWEYLSRFATQLAGDLIYSRPDLATRALEKSATKSKQAGREKQLDWALASLTIQIEAGSQFNAGGTEHLKQQIKDPQIQQFARAVSALVRNLSAEEIIKEIDKLPDALEKLYLLRQWVINVVNPGDTANIIDFALRLGIQTTEYSPNATHLRELANGLEYVTSSAALESLLRMFEAQRGIIERVGPSLDYVRLQLLLARAESRLDFHNATKSLIDTYLFIDTILDLSTKCSALAYFLSELDGIDPEKKLEHSDNLHSLVDSDLNTGLKRLLDETAEHEFVTRNVLEALAHSHTTKAVDIAGSLNIEYRRDAALRTVVRSMLRPQLPYVKFSELPAIISKLADPDEREEALDNVVERLFTIQKADATDSMLDRALPVLNMALQVTEPIAKTRISSGIAFILSKSDNKKYDVLRQKAVSSMESGLSHIDDIWERIDGAFGIAAMFAKHDSTLATTYLKLAENLRGSVGLQNSGASFRTALRLAVRAYSGLVSAGVDLKNDLTEIKARIEKLDSFQQRTGLWSEIAMKMLRDGRETDATKVVSDELWPMLRHIKEQDVYTWQACILEAAPALYKVHSKSALDVIRELTPQWRDSALNGMIVSTFRHLPSGEPYQGSDGDAYRISWRECLDICELIEATDSDGTIYMAIRILARSIKKARTDLTINQKAELIQKLEKLVDSKLPSVRFIKHNGFRILCKAQLAQLSKTGVAQWQEFASDGRAIPNRADRCFVLSMLASCCRSAEAILSAGLIKEAKVEADQISSPIDRVDRLSMIADCGSEIDIGLARACIREALDISKKQNDDEFEPMRRGLIDLAYDISPELASTLISTLDEDPVRKRTRGLSRQIELRELQKQLLDGSPEAVCASVGAEENVPEAAWMSLGALNAGKASPVALSNLRGYLEFAAHLPLRTAYPIISWCIENASRRRITGARSHAEKTLRGIFGATLLGCDLSERLSAQVSARFREAENVGKTSVANPASLLVKAGEREAALHYIGMWIEKMGSGYIKVCDPFLGPDEVIEILQLVQKHAPGLPVFLVTSRKYHEDKKIQQPFAEAYERAWRQYSPQSPPETQVVIASIENTHDSPVHDRWLITKNAGLRLGTSFNGFGLEKGAEISQMEAAALTDNEAELQNCISMRRRYKGKPVTYESFTL